MLSNFWWWLLITFLALDVFLIMLNGFLRGALKPYIDAVLGLFWVVLLVISFIFFGWLSCLSMVLGSFVFGAITRPIAAAIAKSLLGQ